MNFVFAGENGSSEMPGGNQSSLENSDDESAGASHSRTRGESEGKYSEPTVNYLLLNENKIEKIKNIGLSILECIQYKKKNNKSKRNLSCFI